MSQKSSLPQPVRSVSCVLTAEFSVFGRKGSEARGEFRTTLSNLGSVGFTFGGMFAGHGVYLTGGNARFVLKEFDIR